MNEESLVCPICGQKNPHDRTRCKICGSSLEVMDPQDKSILKALQHISGVGSYKAKKIVDSGITSLDELENADLNSFLKVEGIGESTAKEIMEAIEGSKKDEGGLYLCGECGAFVGKMASTCYNCGTKMDDDFDDEVEDEIDEEEYVEEKPENLDEEEGSLYLCGNCGSFISDNNIRCPYCNAAIEDDEELEDLNDDFIDGSLIERDETTLEETEDDEGGLYLCTNCGSFVSASSDVCTLCGFSFSEDEVQQASPREELADDIIDDLIKESEKEIEPESPSSEAEEELSLDEIDESYIDQELSLDEIDESYIDQELSLDELDVDEIDIEADLLLKESEEDSTDLEEDWLTDDIELGKVDDSDIEDNWVIDTLEVDDSDLKELDREIESALESEYGISADTIKALSLGGDIKLCGNCGRICEEKESICSLCGHEFEDSPEVEVEPEIDTHEEDMSRVTDTMLKALGISELGDQEASESEQGVNVCSVCGAFRREGTDRCPICGSLSSEMPDIEIDEDIEGGMYSDDTLYMCDACGAIVGGEQKACSICGSDLDLARRKIKEESIDEAEDNTEDIISAFFGDYKGLKLTEKTKDDNISFCDVCGALVVQDAAKCPVCQTQITDEPKEEIQGAEFYFGLDEITDEDISQIEDEIEDEIEVEFEDDDEDIDDLLSQLDDQDFEELDSITKLIESQDEVPDEEFDSEFQIDGSEIIDELVEKELDIDDAADEVKVEEDVVDVSASEPDIIDELVEKELHLDDDLTEVEEDEDLTEILNNLSDTSPAVAYEDDDGLEDFDVGAVLDEISKDVAEEYPSDTTSEKPEIHEEDEWVRCPSCDSYVDTDSDVCGVCDHSFLETINKEEETISTTEQLTVSKPRYDKVDVDWIDEVMNETGKIKATSKPERHQPPSMVKGTLDKIKEYEVPVSGISLLAFGGISMYSYGDYGLRYLMIIGLALVGIFMGIGLFTLILLRQKYLNESSYGLIGYSLALGIAAFVPLNICFLNLSLPLIANAGMLGIALGIFWILDFKIHPEYRYYMLWFFGILLMFIVLSSSLISDITSYGDLGYPIIMSMGLGGILVFGGTLSWYRQVSGDTQAYENMKIGHKHLVLGDYEDALINLEKANMVSGKNKKDIDTDTSPLYSKGLALCSMGQYQEAVETFKDVLRSNPDNVCAWNNLGTAYSRMGDQNKAITSFKHALNTDPKYEISWNNLGNALYRSGDYSKALDCYDKALEINSNYRDASMNKSQALIKLEHQGSQIAR